MLYTYILLLTWNRTLSKLKILFSVPKWILTMWSPNSCWLSRLCVCLGACVYECACVRACMYVCACASVYICVYVCICGTCRSGRQSTKRSRCCWRKGRRRRWPGWGPFRRGTETTRLTRSASAPQDEPPFNKGRIGRKCFSKWWECA